MQYSSITPQSMGVEEGGVLHGDYTEDGTVDLKGNPVRRSKRGGWKACSFVVVYEVFERMAYYGISSNLILYLTRKLHQGTVTAANNVTNWVGTIWMTPILGAYVADAHLGRYWTFVIASGIYLSGMSLLTLSVSLPGLRPPHCPDPKNCKKASTIQLAVFYGALYTLAVGTGGTKPNISTIGADQFDEFEPKEKAHKLSFFNWWMFSIFFGTLFANTVLVYIQDNVGWTLGYGLPTAGLAVSILIFLVGSPFYRHKVPSGSPFTRMARVIVAALRKWRVPIPTDPKEFYELDLEEYNKNGVYRIDSTPTLRFVQVLCRFELSLAALRKWRVPIPTDPKEFYELDLEEYNKNGVYRIDSTPTLRFVRVLCRFELSCEKLHFPIASVGFCIHSPKNSNSLVSTPLLVSGRSRISCKEVIFRA
ncbi:hypothetical protein RHMOL_Rhmol04G0284900 [Rhododendron molle]|uniref:Uncharacterized protein n=1 Tax=Rhododendron molle TaxID=49168 RepID=A0ACC0P5D2_RHOML|nr:hypothetical protein RHMOL_Rhmol04G0284900 [Rhododendron molle]